MMRRRCFMFAAFVLVAVGATFADDQSEEKRTSSTVEGKTRLDGRDVAFQVFDRDGNGDFRDEVDRLRLDLNGDGKFSPLREQFACQSVIKIAGKRYTLAFVMPDLDPATETQAIAPEHFRVAISPLVGTGFIVPQIASLTDGADVTDFKVTLVSDGGVHVIGTTINSSIEVPVGTYRVESMLVGVKDDRRWKMAFAKSSGDAKETIAVADGQTVEFDVLGTMKLDGNLSGNIGSPRVSIAPSLTTTTGLYLERSLVGPIDAQYDNRLNAKLVDLKPGGKREVLAVEGTGFACGSFCPITFNDSRAMTPTSVVVLQFDAGPLGGPMIRVAKPSGSQIEVSDALDFE